MKEIGGADAADEARSDFAGAQAAAEGHERAEAAPPIVAGGPDWPLVAPDAAGFPADLAERVDAYQAKQLPRLQGFLLLRNGRLVLEQYYGGTGVETLFDVRSAAKSFTSAAVGLALADGAFASVDEPLERYVPEELLPPEPAVRTVTLRELLTMSSGLYWRTGSKLGEAFIGRMHRSRDWLRFIVRLPVVPELRGRFLYRSPDSHLLSCLVQQAAGRPMEAYLRERLFEPLGVMRYRWETDPQGHTMGHIGLRIGLRELARFGELYLHRGKWSGRSLLPDPWIVASHTGQSEGLPGFGDYGYQWWVRPAAGYQAAWAWGHGGNFIAVLPEVGTVAVAVSDPAVNRWRDPRPMLERAVLAVLKP